MILVVLLLILVVIVLGVWGATAAAGTAATSAAALTLATTNAVSQTTILVLTCALIASLPLLVFGAIRLGAFIGERKRGNSGERVAPVREIERGSVDLIQSAPVAQLPEAQSEPTAIALRPRVRRASRRTRQAAQIAQRWFR